MPGLRCRAVVVPSALRTPKVADPGGFAGLAIEDTGYNSFLALARACREDAWVLDRAALDRPLFPAIDEATGLFLFTESFQVRRVCKRLIDTTGRQDRDEQAQGGRVEPAQRRVRAAGGGGRRRGRGEGARPSARQLADPGQGVPGGLAHARPGRLLDAAGRDRERRAGAAVVAVCDASARDEWRARPR